MKKEDKILYYKEEFIKRYKYLYENSEYILAPFMYEETDDDIKDRVERYKKLNLELINDKPLIYLNVDEKTLALLEDFLFCNGNMEESSFYKKLEYLKTSAKYGADVEYGKILLDKKNRGVIEFIQLKLNLWTLLKEVRSYILDQSGDVKNKKLKLEVLDEYFRVDRYSNDGKIWTSGFSITVHDVCNYDNFSMIVDRHEFIPSRSIDDIGVTNNEFINFFGNTSILKSKNNAFHFSEKEKQNIYLSLHDELPWDLKVSCLGERLEPSRSLEIGYPIWNNPIPCGSNFTIKESDIFIDDSEEVSFYQLCPECGYMVRIPREIINTGVQERIINRHKESVKQLKK